ncbi:hypothetical protein LJC27_02990 [Christensenellaceae bacterium OttesenSCG-928-M15]|nr:hypothetical protein [Christensenellaceae bacterium OttesenSCG-928-M15]
MGIFGDSGIFGKLCDFNGDGKVDCFEQTMEFALLDHLSKSDCEQNADLLDDFDDDSDENW